MLIVLPIFLFCFLGFQVLHYSLCRIYKLTDLRHPGNSIYKSILSRVHLHVPKHVPLNHDSTKATALGESLI